MAEGGIIYTKTIDSSVQDGIDNNLILQPNYAFQKKFPFGSDWNHIKIGMFISYTNSLTLPNQNFTSGMADISSGGTAIDTWNYFGIIKDAEQKYLPGEVGGDTCYLGIRYHRLHAISSNHSSSTNKFIDDTSDNIYTLGQTMVNNNSFAGNVNFIPFTRASETTSFAQYHGISFNQSAIGANMRVIQSVRTVNSSNFISNISLESLKYWMNGNDVDLVTQTMSTENMTLAQKPDSLFFYNAFVANVRPRIHALAVKKIS